MRILKAFVPFLIAVLLTICTAFSAFALNGRFYLSSEEACESRLFEVCVMADCSDVASFVAEIEFDPKTIAYRSAKSLIDGAEYSVNADDDGKIVFAWVCASGVDCNDTALLSFEFKALEAMRTNLSLDVSQAINSDCGDISAEVVSDLSVEILPKKLSDSQNKTHKTEDFADNESQTQKFDESKTVSKKVYGKAHEFPVVGFSVVILAALLTVAVVIVLQSPHIIKRK